MKSKSDVKKRRESFTPAQTIPEVISFRLSEDEATDLAERASEESRSPHQMAHDLVLKSLDLTGGADQLGEKLQSLQRQMLELREELSLVAEVLLANAGKVTPTEASQWADQNMKPR